MMEDLKENFNGNISRIRLTIKRAADNISQFSIPIKILLAALLFFILPSLATTIMVIIPAIISLFFINDNMIGIKRGVVSFILATISQLFIVFLLFIALVFKETGDAPAIALIMRMTADGILMLAPGYLLSYLFYGLNFKKPDGKIYVTLIIGLIALLTIRNSFIILY